jgi:putative endonuclease
MKTRHNYYVYIIECSDGLYYTGVTNDLERRIQEHNEGLNPGCFTFKRRPVILRYSEHFINIQNAIAYEKQLKGWSRKKKEALFIGNIEEIKRLAKSNKHNDFNNSVSTTGASPGSA